MTHPMLGDIELQLVQQLEVDEDHVLTQHGVPALEGDFLQQLGRCATQFTLTGVLTGAEVADSLKTLRKKFRDAEPVSFVADIASATKVDKVLIEEMGVRELAGKPERFEYAFTLREFISPAVVRQEAATVDSVVTEEGQQRAESTVEDIAEGLGRLEIHVTLAGGRNDFTGIVVLVEGQKESGERVTFVMEEQVDGVYTRENVPAGQYTFKAFRR